MLLQGWALFCLLAGSALAETTIKVISENESTIVNQSKEEKIYGGSYVSDGEVPWLVAINYAWSGSWSPCEPLCSGVIISLRHVLTAASCLNRQPSNTNIYPPTNYAVFAGTLMSSGISGTKHQVVRFTHHEDYNSNTHANDISIWEVHPPITISNRAFPIALPLQYANLADDFRVVLAGFGHDPTDQTVTHYGIPARKVYMTTVGTSWCRSLHSNSPMVTSDTICAGNPNRACDRDYGGPLYHNGVLYGLAKYGQCGPGSPNVPGLYTKVSNFVDWIRDKTGIHPSS